ncbi:hypothetical protein ACVBEF_18945 [Glaciimonas sp. GG7]
MLLIALKTACLLIYGLALTGTAGAYTTALQIIAAALICIHVLELPFVFNRLRLYRGAFIISILLSLLFGLVHWLPLLRRQNHIKE